MWEELAGHQDSIFNLLCDFVAQQVHMAEDGIVKSTTQAPLIGIGIRVLFCRGLGE